jgi:acyl-CoA synthetase (AMP-forming)/AMP-acid ligase II
VNGPSAKGTVFEAFQRSVERYRDNDFLCILPETARHYGIEARTHSYDQAAREVAGLASLYRRAGLGHGHRVGLMLENRPALFLHWLALNCLGASVVPINSDWRGAELEYIVGHSEMAAAVVPPSRESDMRSAALRAGRDVAVVTSSLGELPRVSGAPQANSTPDEFSECALLYTSGTTGRPKGCVLTNEYFVWAGTWYAQAGGLCRLHEGTERLLTPLPMTHMNAMACSTMAMVLTGGCVVPLDRFHPSTWWSSVRDSRATIVHYLGVMPAMLLGVPSQPSDRQHAVRFGFGAGVSPRLHAQFESRFGFPLLEAWAMTETGAGAVMIANQEPRKVGSACFGKPSPLVEMRIVTDQGADTSAGQHGELWVRSAAGRPDFGFFREYLKDPQATAQAWEGGYFHTGDIVYADEEGDLHFVDRKKNVIRRSGENISAVEVESVILQHPEVAGVGVAAVPDEVRGDEVMACVVARSVLSEAQQATLARELVEFCLARLAYFKAPGFVAFCEQLPLTATEKIQRARLSELAREMMGTARTLDLRALKKRRVV